METDNKKTEKLVTAIYLITGFFDEKEPMRWRLRELGGRLIGWGEKRQIVSEIMSLLTVGKQSGLVSDMNFEIIYREFSRLLPDDGSVAELFAESKSTLEDKDAPSAEEKAETKPHLYISSSVERDGLLPPVKDISARKSEDKLGLKEFGVVAVKKNGRQSIIINILKRKKEIMIKDVSPLIEGVSEKTIQRELLAMVKAGILRKEGEKRWSKYSLAE